jgi:hypothetical protein
MRGYIASVRLLAREFGGSCIARARSVVPKTRRRSTIGIVVDIHEWEIGSRGRYDGSADDESLGRTGG